MAVEEMARVAEVSPRTVERWIVAGELSAMRVNNQFLICPGDAAAFFRKRAAAKGEPVSALCADPGIATLATDLALIEADSN